MSEQSVGEMFHNRAEDLVSRVDMVAGMTPTFVEESVFPSGTRFTFDERGFPKEYTTSKGTVKPLSASSEEMTVADFVGEQGSLFIFRKAKYPHQKYSVLSNHLRRFAMPRQFEDTTSTALSDIVLEKGVDEELAADYIATHGNNPHIARLQSEVLHPEIVLDVAARLNEWFVSLKQKDRAGVKIHTLMDIENDISLQTITLSANKPENLTPEKDWETDEMALRILVTLKRAGIPVDQPITVFVIQEFNDMLAQNKYSSSLLKKLRSTTGLGGTNVALVFDTAREQKIDQSEDLGNSNDQKLVINSGDRLDMLAHELGHSVDPNMLDASHAQREGFATAIEYLFDFDDILERLRSGHFSRTVTESMLNSLFFPEVRAGQPENESYNLSATFLAFVHNQLSSDLFLPFCASMIETRNIRLALESTVPNHEGSQVLVKERANKILRAYFKALNEVGN